jgi:hypothetical protein
VSLLEKALGHGSLYQKEAAISTVLEGFFTTNNK